MRNTVDSDVSGLWSARATIGTHTPLGVDVSYIGTAVDISPIPGGPDGTLIGTGVEGAVRWNMLPHYAWNPYAFIGAGWQHYNIQDATFDPASTGLQDEDDLAVLPVGGGIAYRDPTGLVVDLRGGYRFAEDSDLLRKPNGELASLDTWEASGSIGYEF
jgi:hypothetical protein